MIFSKCSLIILKCLKIFFVNFSFDVFCTCCLVKIKLIHTNASKTKTTPEFKILGCLSKKHQIFAITLSNNENAMEVIFIPDEMSLKFVEANNMHQIRKLDEFQKVLLKSQELIREYLADNLKCFVSSNSSGEKTGLQKMDKQLFTFKQNCKLY